MSFFILLHPEDNILVCTQSVPAGAEAIIDGAKVILGEPIELGHKIARKDMKKGDKILRYGIAIGSLSADVGIGHHVHSHNLQSDYIPAHDRNAASLVDDKA